MQHSDSAADRKLIAERLHAEQWTVERIAAALNVSRRAVTRDLEVPKPPFERRRCKTCHSMFTPKRSDARHCSTACKQKAYRQSLKRSVMPDEALVLVGEARREAIKTIKRRHYARSVPSGKSHYMRFRDALVVWSIPANNNIARFILGWDGGVVWELSRLWAPDGHEKNLLTRAISHAVKRLVELERPDAVVSYADPNVGHLGGVYRPPLGSITGRVTRAGPTASRRERSFRDGPFTLSLRAERLEQGGDRAIGLCRVEPAGQAPVRAVPFKASEKEKMAGTPASSGPASQAPYSTTGRLRPARAAM